MTLLLLVRHGENEYVKEGRLAGRLPGVHLNKNGKEQAKKIAKALTGKPIKAIFSSPLERTMETAKPIAKALDLEVVPRKGLLEVDFGKWEDKKLNKLSKKKLWQIVQSAPSRMRFPGGETFLEAQARVVNELDTLSGRYESSDMIICVSHSDIIKLAVSYFIGQPIDMFQRFHIAPASLTLLNIGYGYSRLLALNYEISFTLPNH